MTVTHTVKGGVLLSKQRRHSTIEIVGQHAPYYWTYVPAVCVTATAHVSNKGRFAMKEVWKDIAGFDGLYQVSNKGRVRSFQPPDTASPRRKNPVIRKHCKINGYCNITLFFNGQRHRHYVHRLVAEAFIGPCPEGMQVNHKNGNRSDNAYQNLEYVTPKRNAWHSIVDLGEKRHGEHNGNAKLTKGDVTKIRRQHAAGASYSNLAEKHGVSKSTIADIIKGRRWNWFRA